MKSILRKILPSIFIKLYANFKNRSINNFYNKKADKRVLISYITVPFRNISFSHSNYYEVTTAARIFDELGYVVDVIHYEGEIPNLEIYDVIYGFGDVFKTYFESGLTGIKTIYYGAGMHVCHQNTASLKRIKDVYQKKGVWLAKSARFVEKTWTHQTLLVDGIIALGNDECKNTYRKYFDGLIKDLPAPFFKTLNGTSVIKNKTVCANKSFLWFGSAGLVHKGLDLCLEYFVTRPDLNLHICANIESEPDFVSAYENELLHTPNIHNHGFVKIDSSDFREILTSCSFAIFPSCSEGGSPSVLTVIGNGGLIPLISKETSVSTGYEIKINQLSFLGIAQAVQAAENLSPEEIFDLQVKNLNYVQDNHNQEIYYVRLKDAIKEILNNEM